MCDTNNKLFYNQVIDSMPFMLFKVLLILFFIYV